MSNSLCQGKRRCWIFCNRAVHVSRVWLKFKSHIHQKVSFRIRWRLEPSWSANERLWWVAPSGHGHGSFLSVSTPDRAETSMDQITLSTLYCYRLLLHNCTTRTSQSIVRILNRHIAQASHSWMHLLNPIQSHFQLHADSHQQGSFRFPWLSAHNSSSLKTLTPTVNFSEVDCSCGSCSFASNEVEILCRYLLYLLHYRTPRLLTPIDNSAIAN